MKIFVDTGAWAALAMTNDQHHKQARNLFEQLKEKSTQLITSDYVLDESLTLIRLRSSHSKAIAVGKSILNSSVVRVVTVDRGVWDSAWNTFMHFKDKRWSFTDCTSFAIMDSLHIQTAFAFDGNFKQHGKKLL